MATNNPAAPQTDARAPLLLILGNGAAIPGAISASVTSNGNYQADRFSCEFALNAQTAGMAWWGNQDAILLDVQVGLLPPGQDGPPLWTSLVQGNVDHVQLNPATGTVSVQGRDLTSLFIEAKTQDSFKNQTSSEVAKTLALRHDMNATIYTTTTLVDRYYSDDHDKITLGQFSRTTTEWDLLTYLARREGFDVFVRGNELFFQPAASPQTDPYVVQWTPPNPAVPYSNAISLRLERSLTLAQDIQVTVRSWSSKDGAGFSKTVRATGAKAASGAGSKGPATQQYVFVRPNLTQDQALQFAQAMLADISKHERIISFSRPADLTFSPRSVVQLTGTGSSWDQTYFVDSVDRSINFDGGFVMNVRCKNHSPQTETQVS